MSSATKTAIAKNKSERKLAPGPKRKALGDQLMPMSRDPLKFLLKIAHEHPDIATFKLGPQRTFLLSKPEYIEDVLVANDWNFLKGRGLQRAKKVLGKGLLTSEGNFHRRQRRLSQPAFTSNASQDTGRSWPSMPPVLAMAGRKARREISRRT